MIRQLKVQEYEKLRTMYQSLSFNLVVDSVIDGTTPAWVFVDNKLEPQSTMMWNKQDALLFAGNAENEDVNSALGEKLIQTIIPDAKTRYIPALTLYCDEYTWGIRLREMLTGRKVRKATRRYYKFIGLEQGWREKIPSGYEIRRIDESILDKNAFENVNQVQGWVGSFWRSNQAFINKEFGYCLMKENTIVSWCLSVFTSGINYELGVATIPEHRKQGMATLAASACVEHCEEKGWIPHWHCWNDNIGSIRVAKGIGFGKPKTYPAYQLML